MLTDRAELISSTRSVDTKDLKTQESSSETGSNNEYGIKREELCNVGEDYDKSNVPYLGDRHLVYSDDRVFKTDSERRKSVDSKETVIGVVSADSKESEAGVVSADSKESEAGVDSETGLSTDVQAVLELNDHGGVKLRFTDLKDINSSTKDSEDFILPSSEGTPENTKCVPDITPSDCGETVTDVIHSDNVTLIQDTEYFYQVITSDNDNLESNNFHSLTHEEEKNIVQTSSPLILNENTTVESKVIIESLEYGDTLQSSNKSSVASPVSGDTLQSSNKSSVANPVSGDTLESSNKSSVANPVSGDTLQSSNKSSANPVSGDTLQSSNKSSANPVSGDTLQSSNKSSANPVSGDTLQSSNKSSANPISGDTLQSSNKSSVANQSHLSNHLEDAGDGNNLAYELEDISRILEVDDNNTNYKFNSLNLKDNQNIQIDSSNNNNNNNSDNDNLQNSIPREHDTLSPSNPESRESSHNETRQVSETDSVDTLSLHKKKNAYLINSEVTEHQSSYLEVNSNPAHSTASTTKIAENLKNFTPDTKSNQVQTQVGNRDSESVNSNESITQSVRQEENSPKDSHNIVRFNTDSDRSESSESESSEENSNSSQSEDSGGNNNSDLLYESNQVSETNVDRPDYDNPDFHQLLKVSNYADDLTAETSSHLLVGSSGDLPDSEKAESEPTVNTFVKTDDDKHCDYNIDIETFDQVNLPYDICISEEKNNSPIQDKQIKLHENEAAHIESSTPADIISQDHQFQILYQQGDSENEGNIGISREEIGHNDDNNLIHKEFFVAGGNKQNRLTDFQDENDLKISVCVNDSPRKSVYSEDFIQENSRQSIVSGRSSSRQSIVSGRSSSRQSIVSGRSSILQLDTDGHCSTPPSYISSDDRAISSRPRVPHYNDSGQNTSNDEAEDLEDFAQMNTAPPNTALNESVDAGRGSRPKSSHPRRRKQIKDSVVYSHRHGAHDKPVEAVPSSKDNIELDDTSPDQESSYNDGNRSDDSYSDDLESMSIQSNSNVSRNDAVSIVSDANHFISHLATPSSQPSISSTHHRQETFQTKSGEGWSREGETLSQRTDTRMLTDNGDQRTDTRMLTNNGDDRRLNRITSATENLTNMQQNLQDMFRQAKTVLSDFQSQLKSRPINDLTEEVPEFTKTLTSLSEAYRACEAVTGGINEQLQDIRVITNEICDLLSTNVKSDELKAWADQSDTEDEVSEETKAKAKVKVAKILEAKAVSARAAATVLTAHELAAQAQAEASQAEAAAANARDEAVMAVQRAESTRKAALEKRRKEEEERKNIAEKQRLEEEKRRLKKEKEEKEKQLTAGSSGRSSTNEVDSTNKEDKSRALQDPAMWPRFIYSIDQSDFDTGVGVVIKSPNGHLQHEDVVVTLVDQLTGCLPMGECEELISNIVRLSPSDTYTQTQNKSHTSEYFILSLPHCAPRIHPGREPVIRRLTSDDKIVTLATSEVQFDDIKDIRFVECRTKSFGTFAVFLRLKKETLTFNRRGGKVISSADSRVTLACQSGTFSNNVSFTLEVQQIDPNVLTSLKLRSPDECEKLLSTSPIITMDLPVKFITPITLTLPVPPNPSNRPRRPQTAGNKLSSDKMDMVDIRLSSARSSYKEEETVPDELHLLLKEIDGLWSHVDNVHLIQIRKKDIVVFDIPRAFSKLAIIRTKPEVTPTQAEKMFCQLMTALTYKQMSVIMRQKSSDPSCVVVTCSQSVNLDRTLRALADERYDHGPRPTSDITVTEGQSLCLRFRGNVVPVDNDVRTMFAFNTYIPFRLKFRVCELDKFAQRGFDSYRGFSQIFTTTKRKRFLDMSEEKDQWSTQGQQTKDHSIFDGDMLLCEQLIILPKPEPETPKPLRVAPLNLSTEGVVNGDLFRFLAVHLEYSDWRKLAQLLNVKHNRIQAILRQNVSKDVIQSIYDMLVTWSKRLPRSMDRTEILCKALACIRRPDLAEELLNRDVEFRQTRAHQFRDSHLHKAFVTIVRHPQAVTQWRELARYLGVSDSEAAEVKVRNETDQGRCLGVLNLWRFQTGDEATISLLATKLKQCRFRQLAKDVEQIYQLKC